MKTSTWGHEVSKETHEKQISSEEVTLPERLISSTDLNRAIRELKDLDDWLAQVAIRKSGKAITPPKTTPTLEELATVNKFSLLKMEDREQMLKLLNILSATAPRIHMSFAVEPSAVFTRTIIAWLRSNISPLLLLEIGLQPTLAAGCMVRTTNKMFDMSLRHRFFENRSILVEKIRGEKSE